MAGSLVGLSYKKDDGTFYAITRDESNARAQVVDVNGNSGTALFLPAASPFVGTLAPAGFRERYLNTQLATDPRIKRRFPVGNPLALAVASQPGAKVLTPAAGGGGTALSWNVNSARGERGARNVNFISDTGQDDGTPGPGIS